MLTEKYRIVLRYSTAKEAYEALAPEVPGCEAEGATRAEALSNLEQELAAQLENMQAQGVEPPPPIDEQSFDGRIAATVSPELHRELVFWARESGLELPAFVAELLARQAGGGGPRRGRPAEGKGPRRGGPLGQRYHDIMDNRENFIEYVRSLDGGGAGGGAGGGGPRRGGGRRPR